MASIKRLRSVGGRHGRPWLEAAQEVVGGEDVVLPAPGDVLAGLAAVGTQGHALAREALQLSKELVAVGLGRSAVAAAPSDRRFVDPAWSSNPVYRRIMQSYLATSEAVQHVVDGLDDAVGTTRAESARFTTNLLTAAAAPTNYFVTNPAAIKRCFDTGGASVVRGMEHLWSDLRHNGGFPSMVDRTKFEVGGNLAVTPGAVVARDEVAEVLQYRPSTETVHRRPLLVVPPPIGRYYFLDLAPGRSFVEYAVSQGFQTFLVSWRNPTAEQADWDLDTYAARASSAIDTVRSITGANDVNVAAFCAGGIISAGLLSHMAARDDARVNAMSFAVTLLDFSEPAPISAFADRRLLAFARWRSRRAGIITSRQMASAFTLMRPNDLIFNYWVNNYLMGEKPPAFDVLAWNADGTNLSGALHGQFLEIFRDNPLVRPGGLAVLGTPVDLRRITIPTFAAGAITDHLTPWKGCYRSTQLLGGESTFVLSYSGHIASLVNPPGNPKAHYWVGDSPGADPDDWLRQATRQNGSWWEPWERWMSERSGGHKPAPKRLGNRANPAREPAPGLYVRDRMP